MANVASTSPYAAAGAYRGFTLQDIRLAFHLLSVPPECRVSIEHQDDIAIHFPDGHEIHEQVKSAPKSGPLRDTAPELWKTLANWGESVNPVTPSTTRLFQLYVTPPRTGHIAAIIHAAKTDADADAVINAASELLKAAGKTLRVQLNRFQNLPAETQRYVIRSTTILSIDGNEYDPLYALMGSGISLPPAVVEQAVRYIVGSAQTVARELMAAGATPILSGDEFKAELQAFVRRTNMQRLLPSAAKPDQAAIDAGLVECPVFVRQLQLVKASRDEQISAVADFLRASASKATWAADGLVVATSFDRWDEALSAAHGVYRLRAAVEHGEKPPEHRGRVLLAYCYLHKEKLDADDVGQEFVRGSFHGLAENKRVGWHDDYEAQLAVDK